VAEREVLRNAIRIRRIHLLGGPERTAALGILGGHQMAFPRAQAHGFAAARYLEALGYGFARFNSLRASHIKLLSQKERET
jgi:hypothetical protein